MSPAITEARFNPLHFNENLRILSSTTPTLRERSGESAEISPWLQIYLFKKPNSSVSKALLCALP
jgi:hypothetical protein